MKIIRGEKMTTSLKEANEMQQVEVVGVRFKRVGKMYNFLYEDKNILVGQHVLVETLKGIEYGKVIKTNFKVFENDSTIPLKKIIRIATEDDRIQEDSNRLKEIEAIKICLGKIKLHGIDMKLIDAEISFDLSKIIFYFTSDGRVDFRALVKDLAAKFRMRIELRQIGVRDEAKITNGIGICGRTLCCATFLDEFQPVSIKMAKEQNLSLNPTKISGACGRLMCCLKYEEDTYEFLNIGLPNVGDSVETVDGVGTVLAVNVLQQVLKVSIDAKQGEEFAIVFYNASETTAITKENKTL
jgi:cell fate regulator YaaT (PSP1 superfamily)